MNRKKVLLCATAFVLAMPLTAQTAALKSPAPLELRLEPEEPPQGVPQAFTVVLINKSDHKILLPMPATDCEGSFTGVMGVSFNFTPLKPAKPGVGHGCANDTFYWPPIMERVKAWKVLDPGATLSARITADGIFCECRAAGKYEFWAGYLPPYLTPEDKETLTQAGIDFPHSPLESPHITYEKSDE